MRKRNWFSPLPTQNWLLAIGKWAWERVSGLGMENGDLSQNPPSGLKAEKRAWTSVREENLDRRKNGCRSLAKIGGYVTENFMLVHCKRLQSNKKKNPSNLGTWMSVRNDISLRSSNPFSRLSHLIFAFTLQCCNVATLLDSARKWRGQPICPFILPWNCRDKI